MASDTSSHEMRNVPSDNKTGNHAAVEVEPHSEAMAKSNHTDNATLARLGKKQVLRVRLHGLSRIICFYVFENTDSRPRSATLASCPSSASAAPFLLPGKL